MEHTVFIGYLIIGISCITKRNSKPNHIILNVFAAVVEEIPIVIATACKKTRQILIRATCHTHLLGWIKVSRIRRPIDSYIF